MASATKRFQKGEYLNADPNKMSTPDEVIAPSVIIISTICNYVYRPHKTLFTYSDPHGFYIYIVFISSNNKPDKDMNLLSNQIHYFQ